MPSSLPISDKLTLVVGLSAKFNSPQVELRREREKGGMKRLFVSPTVLKALHDAGPQVSALLLKFQKDMKKEQGPRSSVEVVLDERKSLLVSTFVHTPYVSIETNKDGVHQPNLSFNLNCTEWATILAKKDQITAAIRDVRKKKLGDNTDTSHCTVMQYRGLRVKIDGSAPIREGDNWNFVESEALLEGQRDCPEGWMVLLEQRPGTAPTLPQVRNVAMAYLLHHLVKEHAVKQCSGCDSDPEKFQPNQLAHMGPGGCLSDEQEAVEEMYAEARERLNPFDVATLFQDMIRHLQMDRGQVEAPTSDDEGIVKDLVLKEESRYPELNALCMYIHQKDISDLASF
jgi:hypothetical protein